MSNYEAILSNSKTILNKCSLKRRGTDIKKRQFLYIDVFSPSRFYGNLLLR